MCRCFVLAGNGDGMQVRDWLYVEDHCHAILAILEKGRDGEIYNIGGNRSIPNKSVVERILAITGKPQGLMESVADRPPLCAFEQEAD